MIITSTTRFRSYSPISYQFDHELLKPVLRNVERVHIKPVLGQALLDRLDDYVSDGSGSGSGSSSGASFAALQALLPKVEEPLALLATAALVPTISVQVGNAGLHTVWNENFRAPFQWQVGDFQDALQMMGMQALDALVEHLEENAAALPEWKSSEAFTAWGELLIHTADEFSRHHSIAGSRTTFMDLRPAMRRAQQFDVGRQIGQAMLQDVLDHLSEASSSGSGSTATLEEWDTLVDYLQAALAGYTIAQSTDVQLKLVDGGLVSTRLTRNTTSKDGADSTKDEVMNMRRQARATADQWMAEARLFLDEHAAKFPTYQASDLYREDTTDLPDPTKHIHNSDGFLML